MPVANLRATVERSHNLLRTALNNLIGSDHPPARRTGLARAATDAAAELTAAALTALEGVGAAADLFGPMLNARRTTITEAMAEILGMAPDAPMSWVVARARAADTARNQLGGLAVLAVDLAREAATAADALDAAVAARDDARAELRDARATLDAAQRRAKLADDNRRTLATQVARITGALADARREVDVQKSRVARLEEQLGEAQREAATARALRAELDGVRAELATARSAAPASDVDVDELRQRLAAAQAKTASLERELAGFEDELDHAREAADRADVEATAQRTRAESLAAELDEARRQCGSDRVALEAQLGVLRTDIEQARAEAVAERARAGVLAAELEEQSPAIPAGAGFALGVLIGRISR